ncbi:MAG: starch synthase [Eubacteriales bacterium]|nr:starch synthase [Eubacteriales bacterium]
MMLDRNLKILLVAAEVTPFAKTGGLADVAGSLPKALATLGNDVRVVMPKYRPISDTIRTLFDFPVQVGQRRETAVLRESMLEAQMGDIRRTVPVYFIDNYHYFDRDNMYGYWDEAERFAFFCRAVLEMLPRLNFQPDVIHCNDWQTGPICMLLREKYSRDPFYSRIATVYTVHNLRYQGNFPREVLSLFNLGMEVFTPEKVEFYGSFSFMKAGLVYADVITTVSSRYAQEVQTPEFGERMDGILRKRSHDLFGIVNGINIHEFNPKTDPRIYRNYDINNLADKKDNKFALQRELGLPERDVPVIGMVTRLVDQKGLDLLDEIKDELLQEDIQLVVLGTGDPHYEDMLRRMKEKYPDKVAVNIGFNGILAQRIYAGSDMFLMPSRFEPCGLGQLISLRYGTIPIVRATGGLADTVVDYNPETGMGNGFSFDHYSAFELLHTIRRALSTYRDRERWEKLMRAAMEADFSWNRSAAEYLEVFDRAIMKRREWAQIA